MDTKLSYHKIETTDGETHEHYIDGNNKIVTSSSRKLTGEEIDAFNRSTFVWKVLDFIHTRHTDNGVDENGVHHSTSVGGKEAKFLVKRNQYALVEIKEANSGEYEFSLGGKGFYTYHMKDVVEFLEDIFDKDGVTVISLKDEIQF